METDTFESSDADRHAQPLPYAQSVTWREPLALEKGAQLSEVTALYETYGTLSPARDNAVLVCHAISGDSHVARHHPDDAPGWWDILVGPGKPVDTDRYFVICPNNLGGCRGTTGPNSICPETGRQYGADFPLVTVGDMVDVERRLIDHLGIERLLAVVGGSLGGHIALTWGTRFPDRLRGVAALATSPRLTSQALAFDVVGRNAILRDPAYQGGQYYENGHGPAVGLALARMLGHITYLSREAMMEKFDAHRLQPHDIRTQFETKFSVGSYLAYQGHKFVERFDPNSYLALSMAMDLFDLGDTPEKLIETFRAAMCRWLLVSYSSDWLFPPFQSQEIVDALIALNRPVSYCNVTSRCGHDAFLLADEFPIYGELVRAFLNNLTGQGPPGDCPNFRGHHRAAMVDENGTVPFSDSPVLDRGDAPTSIFHHQRLDYDSIVELIPPQSSVLDLGCGSGELLARLRQHGHERVLGVEYDEKAILACVRRGLDVLHADLNQGLAPFADQQFDYVVLSQTLQAVLNVEKVVTDMLRVGRRGIVSFPNFGYRKLRAQLAEGGLAPRSAALPYYWYNTPNVRFLTIDDFRQFCQRHQIHIHEQVALDTESGRQVHEDPNLNADVAIFVISR